MDTVGDRIEDIGRRKLGKTGKALAAALDQPADRGLFFVPMPQLFIAHTKRLCSNDSHMPHRQRRETKMPEIPCADARESDFGDLLEAMRPTGAGRPSPASLAAVPLWGIEWMCSFDGAGRVQQVSIRGQWMPARATLRDSICDAIELAYAEMPA